MSLRDFWAEEAAKLRDTSAILETQKLLLNKNLLGGSDSNKDKQNVNSAIYIMKIINQIRWARIHKAPIVIFPCSETLIKATTSIQFEEEHSTKYIYDVHLENKNKSAVEIVSPRNSNSCKFLKSNRICYRLSNNIELSLPNDNKNQIISLENYLFDKGDDSNYYSAICKYSEMRQDTFVEQEASLKTIQQDISALKNKLSKNGKFITLTEVEHLLIDLPIILCKLGWIHGAICSLNWLKGGGTLLFDWKWFMDCERSKIVERTIKILFKNAKQVETIFEHTETKASTLSLNNIKSYCNKLSKNKSVPYGYDKKFEIKRKYSEDPPLNCAVSTRIGDSGGNLDDWGAALGLYRLVVYIRGFIEKDTMGICNFNLKETIWRFSDRFDFVDDKVDLFDYTTLPNVISQILGVWVHDVYDVAKPSNDPSDIAQFFSKRTDGYRYYVNNEIYNKLHAKIHDDIKYVGFISISEEVMIEPDILEMKNTNLTFRK